jgi:hypothetical protein
MYLFPNARLVFEVVRTNIDRIPLAGEPTERDEDVLEGPSRTVSDETLLPFLNDAQRIIAEEVKGMYLQGLIDLYSGALDSFDQTGMVRPLRGRVERDDSGTWRECRRRETGEHNYLQGSGRKATPERPVYTFDTGELKVFPGPNPTVRVDYVSEPDEITLGGVPNDPFFERGSDELEVGSDLTGPVIMYVTAKAQRTIGRMGLHDVYMSLFERLLRPFRRTWRIGRREKYEQQVRVDEPEVNTEI